MKKGTWTLVVLVIAGVVTMPALTLAKKTPIDGRVEGVNPHGSVEIENLIGSVTVVGWDKNTVTVTGTLGEGPEDLKFESDGDKTVIRVVWPERGGQIRVNQEDSDTDLEINVPKGSSVSAEGVNTKVSVTGVEGGVSVETVNGSIAVSGSPSEVEVEAINGDITITASTDQVSAEAVNGNITLSGVRGDVSAATINGRIQVTGDQFDDAEFETVTGVIKFDGSLSPSGDFQFETHSGEIILTLPKDVSAEFDVETFSGKITNEFGKKARRTSKYGPGLQLYFTTGSGDADVTIESFSGKVVIRKN